MNPHVASMPVLAWLEPEQAGLVRAVAARAGLTITHAGFPPGATRGRPGPEEGFGEAEPVSDLRQALVNAPIKAALFASALPADAAAGSVGPLDDPDLLAAVHERGVLLLSLEPAPAAALDSRAWTRPAGNPLVRLVPLVRESEAFGAMTDVLQEFGPVRTIAVAQRCGLAHGTLGARLYDAMHFVFGLMELPEAIDASYVAHSARGVAPEPAKSLRGLRGDLTANMRFGAGRAAALSLSSRAGAWFRGATLLGDSGCIRLDEHGFEHTDPQGRVVDSGVVGAPAPAAAAGRPRRSSKNPGAAPGAPLFEAARADAGADAIGDQIRRVLGARTNPLPPVDELEVLAMCDAAVLSAKTGQPESPATILRMVRGA